MEVNVKKSHKQDQDSFACSTSVYLIKKQSNKQFAEISHSNLTWRI